MITSENASKTFSHLTFLRTMYVLQSLRLFDRYQRRTLFLKFPFKNLVFRWNIKKYLKKNQYLMTFLFCAVGLRLPQKGQQSSHCHFMIENTFTGIKTSCSVSHLEFLCIPFHTISSILRLINNSVKNCVSFTDRTNINVKAFHRKTTHLFSVYWSKSTAIFILPNQPASCSR